MKSKVLACRDFGTDCPVEFHGHNVMEIMDQVQRHRIEAHGLAPDQAASDEVMKTAAAKVREE